MHHFHLHFNLETFAYTLLTQWSTFKIHVEIIGHARYASVYTDTGFYAVHGV